MRNAKRKNEKEKILSLADVRVGEGVTIESISSDFEMKDRLTDLGFCAGETVKCIMTSPLGDPRAYLIRGTLIALRDRDASMIAIKK